MALPSLSRVTLLKATGTKEDGEIIKLPAAQSPEQEEQTLDPSLAEYDPEGQGRQVAGEVAAVVFEKVPFWQFVQVVPKEKVPGEQGTQSPSES